MAADRSHPQPAQTLARRPRSSSKGDPGTPGRLTRPTPTADTIRNPPTAPTPARSPLEKPRSEALCNSLRAGLCKSPLTDSNRRPPPYHGTSPATGGNRRQRFPLVFAVFAGARFARGCHWLQPRGSIKAPCSVMSRDRLAAHPSTGAPSLQQKWLLLLSRPRGCTPRARHSPSVVSRPQLLTKPRCHG